MTKLSFTTAKRRVKPIVFELDGDEYSFKPPKTAGVALATLDGDDTTATKAVFDWLGAGLSDEQHDLLIGRLKDPKDDLDLDTLSEIVKALIEQVSGRPTG